MNLNTSSTLDQAPLNEAEQPAKKPGSRKHRYAWGEAPHMHDIVIKRLSLYACLLMAVVMVGVLLSRLFGA